MRGVPLSPPPLLLPMSLGWTLANLHKIALYACHGGGAQRKGGLFVLGLLCRNGDHIIVPRTSNGAFGGYDFNFLCLSCVSCFYLHFFKCWDTVSFLYSASFWDSHMHIQKKSGQYVCPGGGAKCTWFLWSGCGFLVLGIDWSGYVIFWLYDFNVLFFWSTYIVTLFSCGPKRVFIAETFVCDYTKSNH